MSIITTFIFNAIHVSTSFLYGCTGEIITEKSGHLNLGIPGVMCVGALGGCLGVSLLGECPTDPSFGTRLLFILIPVLMAMLFGAAMGVLYSFLTVSLRSNQNITGLAITTFGIGLYNFYINKMDKSNFSAVSRIYSALFTFENPNPFTQIFLSYGALVYLAIAIAIVAALVLNKTRVGLHLRAVGESPATADAAGINVTVYRYLATVIGSAIAAIGGLFYVMDYSSGNIEYVIDAMGWLAVALVIFSLWKPGIAIVGSIFFAAFYILPNYVNVSFAMNDLLKGVPYLVTIVVLIITSMRKRREDQPPASLGTNYFREDR